MTLTLEDASTTEIHTAAAMISPADFARMASRGRWLLAPHLNLINQALLEIMWGGARRLMVFMPPRHGKSMLISEYLPACYLGNFPNRRVILASYEAEFAASWGRKAKRALDEYGDHLWGVKVDGRSAAAKRWNVLNRLGGMDCAGVGGPLTGKGADLLVCDDPVKNSEEAHSKVYRDKTWDWWQSTFITRCEPGGAVVLMMTRWHEDDLAGRLLARERNAWKLLSFPAVAEAQDVLGRQAGDALWEDRWPLDALEERKREVGSYTWNALFQQRPAPEGGSVFRREWFRYYTNSGGTYKVGDGHQVECDKCWTFSTVDLAASTKTSADYTVISTWSVTPHNQILLLDSVKARLEGPDQVPLIQRTYERWKPSFIAIEKVGYQLALIQAAIRSGLPVRECGVDKDKLSRALPAAARMESGQVFFPSAASWLTDFESELLAFPHGQHDDQVDTLSAAVAEVTRRSGVRFY